MTTKRILSVMVILVMVALICLPTFATSGEVDYSVKYISKTLEKSEVEYEKKYKVTYNKLWNQSTPKGLNCKVRVTVLTDKKEEELKPKYPGKQKPNTKYFDSVPKYKIELIKNNTTFKKKEGTLENNKTKNILVKKNDSAGFWKYNIYIEVKEEDNMNKIIETVPTSGWKEVSNSVANKMGWKTKVYSGEESALKELKKINDINDHSTSEQLYGKALVKNNILFTGWVSTIEKLESKYGVEYHIVSE